MESFSGPAQCQHTAFAPCRQARSTSQACANRTCPASAQATHGLRRGCPTAAHRSLLLLQAHRAIPLPGPRAAPAPGAEWAPRPPPLLPTTGYWRLWPRSVGGGQVGVPSPAGLCLISCAPARALLDKKSALCLGAVPLRGLGLEKRSPGPKGTCGAAGTSTARLPLLQSTTGDPPKARAELKSAACRPLSPRHLAGQQDRQGMCKTQRRAVLTPLHSTQQPWIDWRGSWAPSS